METEKETTQETAEGWAKLFLEHSALNIVIYTALIAAYEEGIRNGRHKMAEEIKAIKACPYDAVRDSDCEFSVSRMITEWNTAYLAGRQTGMIEAKDQGAQQMANVIIDMRTSPEALQLMDIEYHNLLMKKWREQYCK